MTWSPSWTEKSPMVVGRRSRRFRRAFRPSRGRHLAGPDGTAEVALAPVVANLEVNLIGGVSRAVVRLVEAGQLQVASAIVGFQPQLGATHATRHATRVLMQPARRTARLRIRLRGGSRHTHDDPCRRRSRVAFRGRARSHCGERTQQRARSARRERRACGTSIRLTPEAAQRGAAFLSGEPWPPCSSPNLHRTTDISVPAERRSIRRRAAPPARRSQ